MRISDWSSDVCSSDLCAVLQNVIGTQRGPRTCPPVQVTASGSESLNVGIRSRRTSRATLISMRARLEPRHRGMPEPNAKWRFLGRAMVKRSGIGRASCGGRVCQDGYILGGDGAFKKKKSMVRNNGRLKSQ